MEQDTLLKIKGIKQILPLHQSLGMVQWILLRLP